MKVYAVFLILIGIVFAQQSDEIPLVKIGNITITKKEFVSRYELNPGINNDKAMAKTKEIKTSGEIDRLVGSVANSTEIIFYEKNFKEVQVSATPSMVFRILGFGGRMVAVPFVMPQLGWINYWHNKDVQLP